MGFDYDVKFAEMQKYVPFLERMILKLENTGTDGLNPRQAQLIKIKALRDLLLNKNKRMKLGNLMKCEQVLINLYNKVEQNDAFPGTSKLIQDSEISTSSLESVRQKLKNVTQSQDVPSDKSTVLFERRPNKTSVSPTKSTLDTTTPTSTSNKRNYTRVLVSPEPRDINWSYTNESPSNPLYHRRSPKKSPSKPTSSLRKERKRSSKRDRGRQRLSNEKINITLNVPNKSLCSLDTKDIFQRIMTCKENDVDIDQLSILRSQILQELKQTGASQDISDIILRSYKKRRNKDKTKNVEVEEGELSDSESESIEKIYGNLIIELKNDLDKSDSSHNTSSIVPPQKLITDDESRKIKISLVISGSDKESLDTTNTSVISSENNVLASTSNDHSEEIIPNPRVNVPATTEEIKLSQALDKVEVTSQSLNTEIVKLDKPEIVVDKEDESNKDAIYVDKDVTTKDLLIQNKNNCSSDVRNINVERKSNPANFYQPLNEKFQKAAALNIDSIDTESNKQGGVDNDASIKYSIPASKSETEKTNAEIPFLSETEDKPISEIDILKALKNDILNGTIDTPGSSPATPILHLPRVTKVAENKIAPILDRKKRISYEKYKEKSSGSSLNESKTNSTNTIDSTRKTNRGLTEKECERFNFFSKFHMDNVTSDEDISDISVNDVYGDLAPKSPDIENNIVCSSPKIIPSDTVITQKDNEIIDVDLRQSLPVVQVNVSPSVQNQLSKASDMNVNIDEKKTYADLVKDPRSKRPLLPNPLGPDRTPNAISYIITPTTPRIDSFDDSQSKHIYAPMCFPHNDDNSFTKDYKQSPRYEDRNVTVTGDLGSLLVRNVPRSKSVVREDNILRDDDRKHTLQKEQQRLGSENYTLPTLTTPSHYFGRSENPETSNPYDRNDYPLTPVHPFGRSDCPPTPRHHFGRSDCPPTPGHPFGRSDCPPTPVHHFGRTECPSTPIHPFGRSDYPSSTHHFGSSDCPRTPSHYFGRADYTSTPSHSFGRNDCPPTPSHPFGRQDPRTQSTSYKLTECPPTPVHHFGRSAGYSQDPRLNRNDEEKIESVSRYSREICRSNDHRIFYKDNYSSRDYKGKFYSEEYRSESFDKTDARRDGFRRELSISDHPMSENIFRREPSIPRIEPFVPRREHGVSRREHSVHSRELIVPRRELSVPRRESSVPRRELSVSRREPSVPRRELSVPRGQPGVPSKELHVASRELSILRRMHSDIRSVHNMRDNVETNIPYKVNKNFSRSQSVGRTLRNESNYDNNMSVQSYDRSFIIDTSVNRTFQFGQHNSDKLTGKSFNERRTRASSVGRFTHGRSQIIDGRSEREPASSLYNFSRARSVGRNLENNENSFNKQKCETNVFKRETLKEAETILHKEKNSNNHDRNESVTKPMKYKDPPTRREEKSWLRNQRDPHNHDRNENVTRPMKYKDPRTRREEKMFQRNQRDPHVTRENKYDSKYRYINALKYSRHSNTDKKNGIIYTNDNIAQGMVLGSGYGVKNYKIPKIKRKEEEKKLPVSSCDGVDNTKELAMKDEKLDTKKDKLEESDQRDPVNNLKKDIDDEVNLSHDSTKSKVPSTSASDNIPLLSEKTCIDDLNTEENSDSNALDFTVDSRDEDTFTAMGQYTSVTSNIEDLIADLDKDLNSPKTLDLKSKNSALNESPALSYVDCSPNISPQEDGETPLEVQLKTCKEYHELLKKYDNEAALNKDSTVSANVSSLEKRVLNRQPEVSDGVNCYTTNRTLGEEQGVKILKINEDEIIKNVPNETIIDISPDKEVLYKQQEVSDGVNSSTRNSIISEKEEVNILTINEYEIIKNTPNEKSIDKSNINVTTIDIGVQKFSNEVAAPSTDKDILSAEVVPTTINITEPEPKDIASEALKADVDVLDKRNTINLDNKVLMRDNHELIEDKDDYYTTTLMQNNDTEKTGDVSIEDDDRVNRIIDGVPVSDSKTSSSLEESASSDNNKSTTAIESLGSLLCILQDKARIKELLGMLNDQTVDSEKIKRKLEKLSEIVSDEEDINTPKEENSDKIVSDVESGVNDIVLEKTPADSENSASVETDNSLYKNEELPIKKKTVPRRRKNKNVAQLTNLIKDESERRITRSGGSIAKEVSKHKKPKTSRELTMLQEDLKEMFISNEVLNATGLRMCRLAKVVDENNIANKKCEIDEPTCTKIKIIRNKKDKNRLPTADLVDTDENYSNDLVTVMDKPINKKQSKFKSCLIENSQQFSKLVDKVDTVHIPKYRPGPKSKKINATNKEVDPYDFDFTENPKAKDSSFTSSGSEDESLASLKRPDNSLDSRIVNSDEIKIKPKRKKSSWRLGVIKGKAKKSKSNKQPENLECEFTVPKDPKPLLSRNFFTDVDYCFNKKQTTYSCRLCQYDGHEIVQHYKQIHPHHEVPLSRINQATATEAIKQSLVTDFQTIRKIRTPRHVCRFCFEIFEDKSCSLENFFKHVVSKHTGEYKEQCSLCTDISNCPEMLDIPLPPHDDDGLLLGYICGDCNYTQISLENLKNHVAVRHDNEQTAVYAINIGNMTQKTIKALTSKLKKTNESSQVSPQKARTLRSNRHSSMSETSTDKNDISDDANEADGRRTSKDTIDTTQSIEEKRLLRNKPCPASKKLLSKINFENDDYSEGEKENTNVVKTEREELSNVHNADTNIDNANLENDSEENNCDSEKNVKDSDSRETLQSIVDNLTKDKFLPENLFKEAHFKQNITESGTKEYICCINGEENHYKTCLLISMKKHVQLKHKEIWDGYCLLCKVIVMPQGNHYFKECFNHFLDKHIDEFPLAAKVVTVQSSVSNAIESLTECLTEGIKESNVQPTGYINVRPLSEMICSVTNPEESEDNLNMVLPRIESVVSLNTEKELAQSEEIPTPMQYVEPNRQITIPEEVIQTQILSEKHQVVIQTMMVPSKIVDIFKCAGKFCSFTTDHPESALLHASVHERIGGAGTQRCIYCGYDVTNGIDLVSHIFRVHSKCQYSCRLCFYRASTVSSVESHIKRMHNSEVPQGCVLQPVNLSPESAAPDDFLSRIDAVPLYMCKQVDVCNFRHYTISKFSEHLKKYHPDDATYNCSICCQPFTQPIKLFQHFPEHGLDMFQCAYCVHGADSESSIQDHFSLYHPSRKPSAYLRHIKPRPGATNKVLPLVSISKSAVTAVAIKSISEPESSVKEAERAIELEKLIGATNAMIESGSLNHYQIPPQRSPVIHNPGDNSSRPGTHASTSAVEFEEAPMPVTNDAAIGSPMRSSPAIHEQVTPTLSSNLSDLETPTKIAPHDEDVKRPFNVISNEIVNLLSDDDDSEQSVATVTNIQSNVPTDPTAQNDAMASEQQTIRIPLQSLFKCAKCLLLFRNSSGFKRHSVRCFPNNSEIDCAYCSYKNNNLTDVVQHYMTAHGPKAFYVCSACSHEETSMNDLRQHMSSTHNYNNIVFVKRDSVSNCNRYFAEPVHAKKAPKRKRSVGDKTIAPNTTNTTIKRYGPTEINQLPINPILDELVHCSLCEFATKVRVNMVRHLQQHANQLPVAHIAPINPVPHLETNEKHFDKMTNLAASSNILRPPDKSNRAEIIPNINTNVPPEAAAKFPQFVPERKRHACGAEGCSYISVDEATLKYHWNALHARSQQYRCPHCPSNQQLDPSRPLTSARIVAHLKMHDAKLYACSVCSYYHHQLQMVAKHVTEKHDGSGTLIKLREPQTFSQPTAVPTMDLKPWQCGLCSFKSMLRPEVVEHCSRVHKSKFQFKCAFCHWRSSTYENVIKHHLSSHPGRLDDVFYFYYKEGSLPNRPDGTPLWMWQKNLTNINTDASPSSLNNNPDAATNNSNLSVNLDLVKTETVDESEITLDKLKKLFGDFCLPKDKMFVCPLCQVTMEKDKECMTSHLYEELNYRKWSCGLCPYKTFHKARLTEHMSMEHPGATQEEPVLLPSDIKIETWVSKLLEHQEQAMAQSTVAPANAAQTSTPSASSLNVPESIPEKANTQKEILLNLHDKFSNEQLQQAFGSFGTPEKPFLTCPKCDYKIEQESKMLDHLEGELAKVRWGCSCCSQKFQTYHQVQMHCKSVHVNEYARIIEASRSPELRQAWMISVIKSQKLSMGCISRDPKAKSPTRDANEVFETDNNSLLRVRFAKTVPPPDTIMPQRKRQATVRSITSDNRTEDTMNLLKTAVGSSTVTASDSSVVHSNSINSTDSVVSTSDADSDDERLVIDYQDGKAEVARGKEYECSYCLYIFRRKGALTSHIASKHYNLQPYTCSYCPYSANKQSVIQHLDNEHPHQFRRYKRVTLPNAPPSNINMTRKQNKKPYNNMTPNSAMGSSDSGASTINSPIGSNEKILKSLSVLYMCLLCEQKVVEAQFNQHMLTDHKGLSAQFVKENAVVYKCSICYDLAKDMRLMQKHYEDKHTGQIVYNYTLYKMQNFNNDVPCADCLKKFNSYKDYRVHLEECNAVVHPSGSETASGITTDTTASSSDRTLLKRKLDHDYEECPAKRRVARKSTAKPPIAIRSVARKSTTKLPFYQSDPEVEGYSFYGTKPIPLSELSNVTTHMPFFGTVVPFKLDKLCEIMNISPTVRVVKK